MDLKQIIKAEASRLGFCVCGFAAVQSPPHYPAYTRWLEAGNQAGMDYLARPADIHRRANPGGLMPGAKTILCLGAQYHPVRARGFCVSHLLNSNPAPQPGSSGNIAAYAQLEDYHLLLPPRMDALAAFIQGECGTGRPIQHKSFTDSAALLERDFAALAGLGWIGRNSCLISPRYGSFLLLGEILLDLEIEPDPPFSADRCGTCRRCIQACPTGCILPDRTIDARRCISYLTIENKGSIPPDLRSLLGEWVFGCDVCQQVCPWNSRAAGQDPTSPFSRQPWVEELDITEEVHLSPEEFNRKFRFSPVKRAKRRGYLRNIAVALGNQADPADPANLPALERLLLGEREALVRSHAAWAVGQIGTTTARQLLENALEGEAEDAVRLEITAALQHLSQ